MTEGQAPPLSIKLLGPFDVRLNGDPLPPLRSRKGQWLLALLVLRQGREVQREWLAETLWPDNLTQEAFTSLRQSLADLRRALGDEASRLRSPTARTLCLDLAGAEADVLVFDAATARGDPASLEKAVSLYRGPLLEGCPEVWALTERDRREQAYLQALEMLAAHALADGNHAAAIDYLSRGAIVDPLRQSLHRALMHVLTKTRQHQAAVQVYQELRRCLHHELSAEPDEETTALYQQIRASAVRSARQKASSSERRSGENAGTAFPSSRTAHSRPAHLPRPLTGLVGREQELRAIHARLMSSRLVSLTGAGGVGKTRLAIEVASEIADDYADGACFIDLAALSEPTLLPQAIAAALGLQEAADANQRGPHHLILDFLRPRQLLLVLDNCEHLIDACSRLTHTLLAECPALRVLATSRQRLGLTGEVVWRVPSLAVPRPDAPLDAETLSQYAATRLFLERATAARADFVATQENAPAVARICRRLDGIPLAIELAAALVELLSVEEIAARLDDRFHLLTGGDRTRPERHQTLRAMIDWSYDRLTDPERALLRRLSVFAGSWSLEAAEAVGSDCGMRIADCGLGVVPTAIRSPQSGFRNTEVLALLTRLVGKSLVGVQEGPPVPTPNTETRYRLLETIRQYTAERLQEAGETDTVRRRHLGFFLHLAEEAEPQLTGPAQATWLARLDSDYDNLRGALEWSLSQLPVASSQLSVRSNTDHPQLATGNWQLTTALRLAGALGRYWQIRGAFNEGRELLMRALAQAGTAGIGQLPVVSCQLPVKSNTDQPKLTTDAAARARALSWAGFLTVYQGDYERARSLCEDALALWHEVGDQRGIAGTLGCLAIIAKDQGDAPAAEALFARSLALWRELEDQTGIAGTLGYLGILAADREEYPAARAFYEESLALRRQSGDHWGIAASLNNLGLLALHQEDEATARAFLEESLEIRRRLGDRRCIAITLNSLGLIACSQGDSAKARACLEESLTVASEIGERRSIAYSLEAVARLAASDGRDEQVGLLCGAAEALRAQIRAPLPPAGRARLEAAVAAARAALGEKAFAAAWAAGRAMPLPQAVAAGLDALHTS